MSMAHSTYARRVAVTDLPQYGLRKIRKVRMYLHMGKATLVTYYAAAEDDFLHGKAVQFCFRTGTRTVVPLTHTKHAV